MVTKSIRLTDDEAAELEAYVEASGEAEADALRQAAIRGLKEMRLERGIRAFREGRGSAEAAAIAGVPRAALLQMLIDMGETLDRGPSRLVESLEFLGRELGDERLLAVAHKLTEGDDWTPIFGPGEAEAIALAAHLRVTLLINEYRGAQYADDLGVQVVTVSDVVVALRILDIISDRAARRKLALITPNTAREVIDRALRALDAL